MHLLETTNIYTNNLILLKLSDQIRVWTFADCAHFKHLQCIKDDWWKEPQDPLVSLGHLTRVIVGRRHEDGQLVHNTVDHELWILLNELFGRSQNTLWVL